jgi:uncharacterized protein
MPIADELLEMLRCPESRAKLVYFAEQQAGGPEFLFCPESRLKYRIDEGIPVMLIEEAERLDQTAADELLARARELGLPNAG